MQMTITARIDKVRRELDLFHELRSMRENHGASRALEECYRQLAYAALEAESDVEKVAVSSLLHEVDRKVGY